jgi:hypothetical protein
MLRFFVLTIGFAALLGVPELAVAECDDGIDNDGDGQTDFPDDPGCQNSNDSSELNSNIDCDDGVDNDGDGAIDSPSDPGCQNSIDSSELDPLIECDDGVDNDGDGFTDYPSDPGCGSLARDSEDPQCDDGIDNEGDGFTDFPDDPNCAGASGTSETGDRACDDGIDSDGDGLVDLNDPGCEDRLSIHENPACDDGHDNDGDGLLDWDGAGVGAPDPECVGTPFAKTEDGSPDCVSADSDGDGVMDCEDSCIFGADPSQFDADGDLCGNVCDTDYDQTGISGFADFGEFTDKFGTSDPIVKTFPPFTPPYAFVGHAEFGQFSLGWALPPGPSGTTPGTTACP